MNNKSNTINKNTGTIKPVTPQAELLKHSRLDSTLLKGLKILEYLNQSETRLGVSNLASAFDLPKSNVHRTLTTLVEAGYVKQDDEGYYFPSLRIWEQGVKVISRNTLRRAALPFMHRLYQEMGETINLITLDGNDSLYIHQISASVPIRTSSTVGERAPAILTVSGKVILSFQHNYEKNVRAIYAAQKNPKPPFKLSELLTEMKNIRENHYGMSASTWRKGINSLAGLITGVDNMPIGAIAVAGAKERFTEEKMQLAIPSLLNTCTELSTALGAH
ncbi:IclR family transcriptional regulator [Aurantivibrio infirmus]